MGAADSSSKAHIKVHGDKPLRLAQYLQMPPRSWEGSNRGKVPIHCQPTGACASTPWWDPFASAEAPYPARKGTAPGGTSYEICMLLKRVLSGNLIEAEYGTYYRCLEKPARPRATPQGLGVFCLSDPLVKMSQELPLQWVFLRGRGTYLGASAALACPLHSSRAPAATQNPRGSTAAAVATVELIGNGHGLLGVSCIKLFTSAPFVYASRQVSMRQE